VRNDRPRTQVRRSPLRLTTSPSGRNPMNVAASPMKEDRRPTRFSVGSNGWSPVGAVLAVGLGVLAAAQPGAALLVAGIMTGILLIRLLRVTLTELVVITMPIMFFPPIGVLLNVAVADLLMPFLVVALWSRN